MQPIATLRSKAILLPQANIDTDQLLPGRFLKRPRSDGYDQFLLRDLRFDADDRPKADFPLNWASHRDRTIIVAGDNFGYGSSREGAVYALYDFGIRCVIAPRFGDIFFNNALKNGLVPVRLPQTDIERLLRVVGADDDAAITVDLEHLTVNAGAVTCSFEIPDFSRMCLLTGQTDIEVTSQYSDKIAEFQRSHNLAQPWLAMNDPVADSF